MGPRNIALSLIISFMIIPLLVIAHDAPPATPSQGSCKLSKFDQDVLDAHNKARAAEGLGPMTWNETLAAYAKECAEKRAKNCDLEHSNGPYGENMASFSAPDAPGADYVKLWVDEKPLYDRASNKCKGGDCLHYTQIVWKDSVRIGCATSRCNNGWTLLVCNYDPPGNWDNECPF